MVSAPALVVLTRGGLATAQRLRASLPGAEIHGLAGRVDGAEVSFADTARHLADLFAHGRPIVGLCAAGILIRALAPHLADKRGEPPVIALAEDGSAVVPLIGGHRGANELARRLAATLGIAAAVTTAGDARFGIALDDPPEGWTLANPADAREAMAALLAGASARIEGDAPWLAESGLPLAPDGAVCLVATHLRAQGGPGRLVYHPKVLALGVGCERGCAAEELIALADSVLDRADLARASIAYICTLDLKADEQAIHALSRAYDSRMIAFSRDELAAQAPRLANPSEVVLREVGVPGVAEAAALAAIGPSGQLIVGKTKSARATCAVALAPAPILAPAAGRPRGALFVVGTGPGGAAWLSPEASALLCRATDWVGYGLYLDLVADLSEGKQQHRFPLGEEEARVRHALELAGEGREVALVSSGDPGIYAMAALACELLDPASGNTLSAAARRVELIVAPGISAFQAAAARAGAPFGHDFCLISLSDLLTPWPVIEKRIRAAAEGDFAVAFYNPKSQRRTGQLARALAILKEHRPPETPVVTASSIGRPEESIAISRLDHFDPGTVDMLTIVLVGSAQTKSFGRGDGSTIVYTPRGYAAKRETAQ